MEPESFDLVVIGAGPAGEKAANTAAIFGKRVAIVEKELAHLGLMAMLTGSGVELFNRVCFNYPTLGELYKYAAYDAMVKQMSLALAER